MTLPVPIAFRLVNSRVDRHIEADLSNLTLRSAVPGGFASARLSLHRPLRDDDPAIAYYTRGVAYDQRNGSVLFDGRLDDIGRGAGNQGEVRELAFVGGAAHARDRNMPHIFVDTSTRDWEPATDSVKYVQINDITSNEVPAIQFIFPEGTTMTQTEYGEIWYRRLVDTGQRLARMQWPWDAGSTTTNNEINMVVSVNTVSATNDEVDAASLDTSGGTLTAVITTDWSAGTDNDVARCWFLRNGPTAVAGNNATVWFIPHIRTVLYDVNGNERTAAANYTSNYVRAHEIINDLLGRILTQFDGPNASVATNTYDIDQLAYQEPVTSADIFSDLMAFHPDHYWAAWERRSDTDLIDFEWRAWATTVRYEFDLYDGFDAPGSAANLYNRVFVRYIGGEGNPRHRDRSSTVALLDDAGLIRQEYLDLKLDAGSEANAIQTGDQFLEDHAVVTNAATLEVCRPVYDRDAGMMRQPWELLRHGPGNLDRVRGVQPTRDALNTTTRNAVTVFKNKAVEFNCDNATSRLELDSEPVDLAHVLVRSQPPPVIAKKRR